MKVDACRGWWWPRVIRHVASHAQGQGGVAMKRHRWVVWAIALTLLVSLFGPTMSGAMAQDDEVIDPSEGVIATTEEVVLDEADMEPAGEPESPGLPGENLLAPSMLQADDSEEEEEKVGIAAVADFKIYAKNAENENLTGAFFAAYDATCTTPLAGPTEVDEFGTLTFIGVAEAGTEVCIVNTTPPPGYQTAPNLIKPVPQEWSIVFTEQEQLYDLPIFKSDGENLIGGAGFTLYDETCTTVVRDEQFVGAADAQDGSAGRTIFTGLAAGAYCVVESTVPEGYAGADPQLVSLPENTSGWTFVNTRVPTYDLPIFKEDDAGALIDGAGFTLYDATGTIVIRAEQFVGDADAVDGSAGRTIFTDLPAGTYLVVESTVPAGYTGMDPVAVSLPEHVSGWTFINYRNTGDLLIVKTYCEVFDPDDARTVFLEGDVSTAWNRECVPGPASFLIYPFEGEEAIGPFTTDAVTGEVLVENLPVGTHGIEEIGSGATSTFTIVKDQTTTVHAENYVFESGWVKVLKYFCLAKREKTTIDVSYPVEVARHDSGVDRDCRPGKAHFEIWLFGNPKYTIDFHTSRHDGTAWLMLPATNETTGPHVIVEVGSGAKAEFDVIIGEKTTITVVNFVKKDRPEKPAVPETPAGGVAVDTLPSTGTGDTSANAAFYYAAGSLLLAGFGVSLGTHALRRQRR
jgi:hypothetical protein